MIFGKMMPSRMTMTNLVKHIKTNVIIHEAQYNIPIDDKYFNPMRFYK